jgi:NO-binding membrane sensor protein with MHYT domain
MLGYTTGGIAGYEPGGTLASLAVSIGGVTAGLAISAYGGRSMLLEAGGVVLGLGLGAMHYLGMSAYEVQGRSSGVSTMSRCRFWPVPSSLPLR